MKTKIKLMLAITILLASLQTGKSQVAKQKFSFSNLPSFVKELQNGPPPHEMMYRDPLLYQKLMKRRAVLTGILRNAVQQKQLPVEALQVLNNPLPVNYPKTSTETSRTIATDFELTKDINTITSSDPYNYEFSFTNSFAVLNNAVYYTADDGIHGGELWRSDGTAAGTYMVKDIFAGNESGFPQYITVFKNKLYFTAFTLNKGWELYQSDGTESGTKLLKDIISGAPSSSPSRFTVAGNYLYFTLDFNSSQLWRTNGSAGGTVMIADLSASATDGIAQLTYANGLVFFTAYNDTYSRELWRSDGTSVGTFMIKDINNDYNNSYFDYGGPSNLTSFNNLLYFSASSNGFRSLYQSDGSTGGTYLVTYNNGITVNSVEYAQYQDEPFAIAKNSLFFAGFSYTTGTELYKYNPVGTAGIVLVKDISTSTVGSLLYTEGIRSMGNNIYFITPDFTGKKYNLWKSGGTDATTDIVKEIPETSYFSYYDFYALGNTLYFNVNSSQNGNEPWVSDGTAAGTMLLKDINTGTLGSFAGQFTLCNNQVFFNALTSTKGSELWKTNGTAGATKMVADANTTSTGSAINGFNYNNSNMIPLNNDKTIFSAYKNSTGYELWESDGTSAGTVMLKDLVPGEGSGYPTFYDSKNGKAYFTAYDSTGGKGIYISDGTVPGTKKVLNILTYVIDLKADDNGNIFYIVYNGNFQLRKLDILGNDIFLYGSSNYFSDITLAGNICYFTGSNSYGYEPWRSDGTIAGTYILADIYPGANSSDASDFTALGNKVFFSATSDFTGSKLWVSNASGTGCSLLSSTIHPYLNGGTVLNDKLYFNGYEAATGYELYSTNGTVAGTTLIKDIFPGTASSSPDYFTTVGNTVFFTAQDDVNGLELWKTTGTAGSTKLVKDITPGVSDSYIDNLTSAGSKLYFTDVDNLLWTSDGTKANTVKVSDPNLSGVYIYYLMGVNNKLFIGGTNYAYGSELYEGDATLSASKFESIPVTQQKNEPGFSAVIATNPIVNNLKININSPVGQQLKLSISNTGNQLLLSKTIKVNPGVNTFDEAVAGWLPGMYIINISSEKGFINLKAIK